MQYMNPPHGVPKAPSSTARSHHRPSSLRGGAHERGCSGLPPASLPEEPHAGDVYEYGPSEAEAAAVTAEFAGGEDGEEFVGGDPAFSVGDAHDVYSMLCAS